MAAGRPAPPRPRPAARRAAASSRSRSEDAAPRLHQKHLVVIGGGAGGLYGGIEAARRSRELAAGADPPLRVTVLEKNREALRSVLISGGGRCNVTTGLFTKESASSVVEHYYPRGHRELRGGFFAQHDPEDVMSFFESRGVPLKTEDDGRVFPRSDDAASIAGCLLDEARRLGVEILPASAVRSLARAPGGGFTAAAGALEVSADFVLLATGGSAAGHRMAGELGHTVLPGVPSLFSFKVDAAEELAHLAGVSVASCDARLAVPVGGGAGTAGFSLVRQRGFPLLLTHRGISGPLVLRLSAFGARLLHDAGYVAALEIDLVPGMGAAELQRELLRTKEQNGRKLVGSFAPRALRLPRRLWVHVARRAGVAEPTRWGAVSNRSISGVAERLKAFRLKVSGRGPPGEEFVTAGGVDLGEIDLRTMQSRLCEGLFFAGEVVDVDGVTGGLNFQNAWTGGHRAGRSIAESAHSAID